MYLTTEQTEIGKLNFLTALGQVRGDFLRDSLSAPSIGSHYFGYGKLDGDPVKAGIVGTGNEGCEAMIKQSSPEYLQFVAYHDIRPSQIDRAPKYFKRLYGEQQAKEIKFHDQWNDLLDDPNVEVIVVATPLWTHARFAIEAMKRGKHVLCEKLMAHNITDAKRMVRTAEETGRVLSIGHQRHYSTLYDNALQLIRSGVLGEIRHIRALWHRNNTWPKVGSTDSDIKEHTGEYVHDSWSPDVPTTDKSVDFAKYGYKSLEELVRWRLYLRTGGGLMAELGSHQLDACSLFLDKVHPKLVCAAGGKYFFDDDRECEDHVYCTFELPGGVVLTYSSINTNSMEGYGEIVTGTKGTLMIMNERDAMLFKEREPGNKQPAPEMHVRLGEGPKLEWTESLSLTPEAALAKVALEHAGYFTPIGAKKAMTNRGYHDEIEAFAHAVRNPDAKVRCDGRVALADTVMALAANVAIRANSRIAYKDAWFDPASDEVPDAIPDQPVAQAAP